jgi:predicted Zn-dependent peptidase
MKISRFLLPVLLAAPVALPVAVAQPPKPAPRASATATLPKVPPVAFTEYKLPNGLKVILSRDTSAPVVSVAICYNVGSFVERPGCTGFAHLFEHMMFQGSENVGKGEHSALVSNNGGIMNGGTSQDYTIYFEQLPANQLPLALFLESDRMGSLDISQANLDNQRNVVQEERRLNYDNRPYGTLSEKLQALAFTQSPYKHLPIGSMEDLNAADLADVRSFFKTWYAPNNAVLAIVGDFDVENARTLVTKYFGDIPGGPKPDYPSLDEPPQETEHRLVYVDDLARLPLYVAAYHIPNGNDPDGPALRMLATILAGGKSSILWQSLVERQQVAVSVGANGDAGRGPDLFSFQMALGPGQEVSPAEAALEAEIARVRKDGVTAEEMETARRQFLTGAIYDRTSTLGIAQNLARDSVVYGNANRMNEDMERIRAVTAADVKRVATTYLNPTNRTVVIAMPPAPAADNKKSEDAQ